MSYKLDKRAIILNPRGKSIRKRRFTMILRRLAEGIFDIEDLKFRRNELADFITHASKAYEFDLQHVISVGYSNGANIAASTLLLRPEILSSAILLFSLFKSAGSKEVVMT